MRFRLRFGRKEPSPLAPLHPGEGDKTIRLPSPLGRRGGDGGLPQHIRATAQALHDYRSQQMEKKQWGITKLYNEYFRELTSQLYKLHTPHRDCQYRLGEFLLRLKWGF